MAQPRIQKYMVPTAEALDQSITSYLAQGFIVANRSPTSVTLQKKKEFKIVWAIIGFVLCLLPLLIYLIIFATQPDVEIVEITISGPVPPPVLYQ